MSNGVVSKFDEKSVQGGGEEKTEEDDRATVSVEQVEEVSVPRTIGLIGAISFIVGTIIGEIYLSIHLTTDQLRSS